jgi:flavodoxin
MKTLIVYKSVHHGNTQKIVEVMAKILNAESLYPNKINPKFLSKYDLIGFGSGVYFSMHHEDLFNFIDKLPKMNNKNCFIITTSGSWNIKFLNDFNNPLKRKLELKGFNILGTFTCRGLDTFGALKKIGGLNKGRPNNTDLAKAKDFASNIKYLVKALK